MAMIKCKECGKEISSLAEKCPHCGHMTRYGKEMNDKKGNKGAFYLGAILMVIGLILFLSSLMVLLTNYNDWYFWHWDTDYAYFTLGKLAVGGGMLGGGAACLKTLADNNKK